MLGQASSTRFGYGLCEPSGGFPPLRERTQDIPELVRFFPLRTCDELGIETLPLMPYTIMDRLLQYSWPGNVRELGNLVKRGVTLHPQGPSLLDKLLPKDEGWYLVPEDEQSRLEKTIDARVEAALERRLSGLDLTAGRMSSPFGGEKGAEAEIKTLDETVAEAIQAALARTSGRISGSGSAAELLDLNPSTLRSKMRKLGLTAMGSE